MKKYLIFGYDKILVDYLILNNIEVSLILDKWDLMDSIQISNNDLEKWFIVNDSQNIENVLEIICHENSDFKKFDVVFSRYESTIVNASILSEFLSKKFFYQLKQHFYFVINICKKQH